MPDTEANQNLYPQPSGQKQGCGFPVMRIVAMFSLATGLVLAWCKSHLGVHERILWHQMWDNYRAGDVVLADRGYCSLADYWLLSQRGVDCVMRLHQRRKAKKIVKRLGRNDYLVQWQKSKKAPKWLTPEQWKHIPDSMTVRQVKVNVDIPGFRTRSIVLATTLLDNKKYPPQALADLYRRRWLAELFLRDLKTTMRMNVVHCKTPEMVHKELTIFIIAYNLIRSMIWKAALKKGIDPYHISFAGALATIRQWAPLLPMIKNQKEKSQFINAILEVMASGIIPIRKKTRREPRAIKRRQNASYQLLTIPRNQFMEIPHRHSYRKNLSLT